MPPFHILAVDDEPDFAELMRQYFRHHIAAGTYRFSFAGNGKEALALLRENRDIQIVLTDIRMAEMDGLELLKELRAFADRPLKAVIVTAYGDMPTLRGAMNRGAYDFFTKPVDFPELERGIENILEELRREKGGRPIREQLSAMEQELSVASAIQQGILPRSFPSEGSFELYAETIPARKVGGDFYDYLPLGGDRVGFLIGDVSGKGVPAAIFMGVSRTALRATAKRGLSPGACLAEANRILCADSDEQVFVSIFYAILDTRSGLLVYSSAGHNPPFLVRAGGAVEALGPPDGPVAGMLEDAAFGERSLTLAPGEALFLYTDGITEAMDAEKNLFSEQRLARLLESHGRERARAIVERIAAEIRAFIGETPQWDDMTCMVVRFEGEERKA